MTVSLSKLRNSSSVSTVQTVSSWTSSLIPLQRLSRAAASSCPRTITLGLLPRPGWWLVLVMVIRDTTHFLKYWYSYNLSPRPPALSEPAILEYTQKLSTRSPGTQQMNDLFTRSRWSLAPEVAILSSLQTETHLHLHLWTETMSCWLLRLRCWVLPNSSVSGVSTRAVNEGSRSFHSGQFHVYLYHV